MQVWIWINMKKISWTDRVSNGVYLCVHMLMHTQSIYFLPRDAMHDDRNFIDRMLFREPYWACVRLLSLLHFIHLTAVFLLFCTSCCCVFLFSFTIYLQLRFVICILYNKCKCKQPMPSCGVCLSVCLSVTFVSCVKTNNISWKFFHHSGFSVSNGIAIFWREPP